MGGSTTTGRADAGLGHDPGGRADGALKVLIVDDEPDTVLFLATWLQDQGFATCTAGDGEEGLRVLEGERPDLVLMDLKMPRRTGMQLYREIRDRDKKTGRAVPVIFVTGMADAPIFGGACEPLPGPAARVDKPVDLERLGAAIRAVLGPTEKGTAD